MEDNDSWDSPSEFTLAEVVQMENHYKAKGDETLNEEFCKKLATNFRSSSNRLGKSNMATSSFYLIEGMDFMVQLKILGNCHLRPDRQKIMHGMMLKRSSTIESYIMVNL
ncbi:hypothetical protein F3Y22_tig00113124pilonHSYRG00632 [Hibiscus syriacus]|uniref:Uncharacterized protein n=1 Tax=Hibiscus syriacus TaxID=106335 RepID=A0A6A2WQV3_HIBSY|nr:hypothetical protein F3Y22_tig00113124pilonHSYRG00632 [Hibiscus syriacus]